MKKIILLASLLNGIFSFCQEKEFTFTKDGITDFVVTSVDNKTQSELFKKTLDWIAVTFKNPKEVLKAQIENDFIRTEGYSKELLCFNTMGKTFYDANYLVEISFKDGKYKFDLLSITMLNTKSEPNIELNKMNEYYKENGNIRGTYKYFPEIIPVYFNNLNISLNDFLTNDKIPSKKNDW